MFTKVKAGDGKRPLLDPRPIPKGPRPTGMVKGKEAPGGGSRSGWAEP